MFTCTYLQIEHGKMEISTLVSQTADVYAESSDSHLKIRPGGTSLVMVKTLRSSRNYYYDLFVI